jgi:FkbM family methyltransferase
LFPLAIFGRRNPEMFNVYKTYPFKIPFRTKVFNLVRALFLFKWPEKFLVAQLSRKRIWWKKLIPPLYFYGENSFRQVARDEVWYQLNLRRMLDHSLYFYDLTDVAWSNLFKMLKPDFNVIDAGANIGYLTLQFSKRCNQGMVYSFEPDTENFKCLTQNMSLNDCRNVTSLQVALGKTNATASLYKVYRNNPGANRILDNAPPDAYAQELVSVCSLDDLDASGYFKKIDLIKVDVEGFEWFVLQGAANMIRRDKPILFIELADDNLHGQGYSSLQLLQYLDELGYNVIESTSMKPLARAEKYQTDIFCFPRGAVDTNDFI